MAFDRSSLVLWPLLAVACGRAARPDPAPAIRLEEVVTLAHARDYFRLRDRLTAAPADTSLAALVGRAWVDQAFNRLDRSSAAARQALATAVLTDSLAFELGELEAGNALRGGRYRDGLRAADLALGGPGARLDSATLADLRNTRKILAALADVPAQEAARAGPVSLRLDDGRIPVEIDGQPRRYIFDTGANLSTIMRSEALALGLEIRPAGIDVGSSTDVRNTADLAVAASVRIGGLELRHVVFLVFDDRLLTMPNGFRIPGIIGFPVIVAMGEVHLGRGGRLEAPVTPSAPGPENLALAGYTPLTRVTWRGDTLLCRLDTGADRTDLYDPLYRRHREYVDSAGVDDSLRTGGVGGMRTLATRRLADVRIGVGDTTFILPTVPVIVTPIVKRPEDDYLDCNIGHDVFDGFAEYVLDFRRMSFRLR